MFERFTERARRVLFFARYESSQLGSMSIEPEHLLLGLLRERQGAALPFLQRLPADLDVQLARRLTKGEKISTSVEIPFSAVTKRALQAASDEADRLKHTYIGTEHLLLALLTDPTTVACEVLNASGLTLDAVRTEIAERPADAGVPDTVRGDGGAEFVSFATGYRAAGGVDSIIAVVQRLGQHPTCTDEGRRLVDQICRDLRALKSIIAGEGAAG